jgi:predicted dehydrogenase
VIASNNADHRRYTEAAAKARVHVLCEKPLATTTADAKAMIDACRSAGVQLGTAFPVRSSPAVMALKEAIAAGSLGRIRAVRATNPGQYPARGSATSARPAAARRWTTRSMRPTRSAG